MSAEDIKALERYVYEEYNKGKTPAIAIMDKVYAADFVMHDATGEEIRDFKRIKKSINEEFDAFPDLHYIIEDMIVEGDKVAIRFTATGTHKGVFMGSPPSNKKMMVRGICIDRFVNGKIVEEWVMYDTLGLMQQLGAVPNPKK